MTFQIIHAHIESVLRIEFFIYCKGYLQTGNDTSQANRNFPVCRHLSPVIPEHVDLPDMSRFQLSIGLIGSDIRNHHAHLLKLMDKCCTVCHHVVNDLLDLFLRKISYQANRIRFIRLDREVLDR